MSTEHWDLDQDNTLGGNSPSPNKVSSQKALKEYIDSQSGGGGANTDLSNLTETGEAHFQEPLVSGTNIKTINNTSILGSGNIDVGANITITYDV